MACLLGCSGIRSSLNRVGFPHPYHPLLSSETWCSWFCTFLMLPIRPRCRLFHFSIRIHICPLQFPHGSLFSLYIGFVSIKAHRRRSKSYWCFPLDIMSCYTYTIFESVCFVIYTESSATQGLMLFTSLTRWSFNFLFMRKPTPSWPSLA